MANPCKNCACCRQQQNGKTKRWRFWCTQGAFDFAHIPEDGELDFKYLQSICSAFDNMDEEELL